MAERGDEYEPPSLRERVARLEEQLRESAKDRDDLHDDLEKMKGRVDGLQSSLDLARAGWWTLTTIGGIVGFVAGILQPWIHR